MKKKYSNKDWNLAKKFFIEGLPLSRIEILTGIPEDYLKQKRSKDGWVALRNKSKEILSAVSENDDKKIEDFIVESCDRQNSIQLIEEIINIRLQQLRQDVKDDAFNLSKDLRSFAQTLIMLKEFSDKNIEDDDEVEKESDIPNVSDDNLKDILPKDLIDKLKEVVK